MPKLYVVATPIGNLGDASPRMLDALRGADLVVAEDTRVTGNLLRHFEISRPLTSLHRHNEAEKAGGIVQRMLEEDLTVALATDAGTPAISDPGNLLVQTAASAGIEVLAIAGPCALAAALSVSGMDAREFAFYGFLPREKGALQKKLLQIAEETPVAVVYESPHRVMHLLEAVEATLPGAMVSASRELTKKHETTVRGDARTVIQALSENPNAQKGEHCLVLDMHSVTLADTPQVEDVSLEARIFDLLLQGHALRDATETLLQTGARKNDVKRAALVVRKYLEIS